MKVSIITPVFNRNWCIQQAITSVQEQNHADIEHIVVDGMSTDGSAETAKRFMRQQDVFICEQDQGVYDALNKGINSATGDLIGILHSDDVFASNDVVARVVKTALANATDLVYGDLKMVSQNIGKQEKKVVRTWQAGEFDHRSLRWGWMPPHPTCFISSVFQKKVGLYNLKFSIAADYEFLLRCLSVDGVRVAYIPETLSIMSSGGVSNSTFRNIAKKTMQDYAILSQMGIPATSALIAKNFRKLPQLLKLASTQK